MRPARTFRVTQISIFDHCRLTAAFLPPFWLCHLEPPSLILEHLVLKNENKNSLRASQIARVK